MKRHREFPTQAVVAIAVTMLVGALTASAAHVDDPLAAIINTVKGDREKACHDTTGLAKFQYNQQLETVAQVYARSEVHPDTPPAGFQRTLSFLGSGDPQAQAINSAYRRGAGPAIGDCGNTQFGVGFKRWEDRSVDVVTIVLGVLTPPPSPTPTPTPTPPIASNQVPPEWSDMLNAHNNTRAGHCAAPLTWNAQLAAQAQAYANQCTTGVHGSSGENLAVFTTIDGSGKPVLPAVSNAAAYQNAWACEENNYSFDNPVFAGGFTKSCAKPVNGHFTQVVWRDTTQLGCGKATCNVGGVPSTFWVCRYLPPGNANATDPNVLKAEVQRPPCK